MSKSKYPNQIDTSIELPIARDNITQITSELFNSLRSAIIQIEKTLGVEPNGADSITVSERLNQSLDDLGNIKKEAINSLNLISGPITNSDVSDNAAIEETKIKLDYKTSTLYGQNLDLKRQIEDFITTINDLSVLISIHLNKLSLNQHNAVQINVEQAISEPINISTNSLTSDTLQNILEKIYNQHINLTPTNITETNNSHKASQIYFDSEDLVLSSTNVQDAIVEVSGEFGNSLQNQFQSLNSNGRIKFGVDTNPQSSGDYLIKIQETSISFSFSDSQYTKIDFVTAQSITLEIYRYDYIEIINNTSNINQKFKIQKINKDSSGNLISVIIFGRPQIDDDGGFSARILRNNYNVLNRAGLLTSVRPSYGRSNSPYITVCNPNSATIISSFCNPASISSSNRNITIAIDGVNYTIDVYDSAFSEQTLESVVFKINTFAVNEKILLAAFILPTTFGDELVLSHLIPNFSGDTTTRTLKILTSSSDDALSTLGLSKFAGKEHRGTGNNSLLLNGVLKDDTLKIKQYDSGSFTHNVGNNTLTSNIGNLLELGIKKGDLIYLNLANTADKGIFNILTISQTQIELDYSGFSFTGAAQSNDNYIVIQSCLSLQDLNLEKVSGLNTFILVDTVYINDDIYLNKKAEYSISNTNAGFDIILSDISKNYLSDNQNVSIDISTNYVVTLTDPLGNTSQKTILSNGKFVMDTPDGFSFLTFYVSGYLAAYGALPTPLAASISISIHGFEDSKEEMYLISRSTYSYNLGFVLGSDSSEGVPKIIDKRLSGTIKSHNISEEFYEKIIEGPRAEMYLSGVITGCEVTSISHDSLNKVFTFDITPGVFYSNGKRREFFGVDGYTFSYDTLFEFFIYFDEEGKISIEAFAPASSSITSFTSVGVMISNKVCFLSTLSDYSNIDLRIMIDQASKKMLTNITVGNSIYDCHFSDLQKAVNYANFIYMVSFKSVSINIVGDILISSPVLINNFGGLKIFSERHSMVWGKIVGATTSVVNEGLDASKHVFLHYKGRGALEISGLNFYNISYVGSSLSVSTGIHAYICIDNAKDDLIGQRIDINKCTFEGVIGTRDYDSDTFVIPILVQKVDSSYNLEEETNNCKLFVESNTFHNCGTEYGMIVFLFDSAMPPNKYILTRVFANIANNHIIAASSKVVEADYNILLCADDIKATSMSLPYLKVISVTGNTYV